MKIVFFLVTIAFTGCATSLKPEISSAYFHPAPECVDIADCNLKLKEVTRQWQYCNGVIDTANGVLCPDGKKCKKVIWSEEDEVK